MTIGVKQIKADERKVFTPVTTVLIKQYNITVTVSNLHPTSEHLLSSVVFRAKPHHYKDKVPSLLIFPRIITAVNLISLGLTIAECVLRLLP